MRPNRSSLGTETLVTAAAGCYGLGLLALAAPLIEPEFRWDGDVINGAVIQAYQKQQESLVYLLALVLVPSICLIGHRIWRRFGREDERLRDRDALAHLPLFAWIGAYIAGFGSVFAWLVVSIVGHIALRVALRLRFVRSRSDHVGENESSQPDNTEHSHNQNGEDAPFAWGLHACIGERQSGLVAPWGIVILAGVATGLTLAAMVPLGNSANKLRSLGGALCGALAFIVLWSAISWIGARLHNDGARVVKARLGVAFFPFSLLFLSAFPPFWRRFSAILTLGVILWWVIWVSLVLARHSALRSSSKGISTLGPFGHYERAICRLFWWVAVPVALYALAYIHDIRVPLDLYHVGERIVPAAVVSDGAIPYRDVFIWHGLYENAIKGQIAFSLFGKSVTGMRQFDRLVEPAGAIAFFLLSWACLANPLGGLVSALVYLLLFAPPNARYLLPYAGFAFFAVWLRGGIERVWPLVVAGALAGCSVFFSLDGGMGAVVSVLILVAWAAIVRRERGATRSIAVLSRHTGLLLVGVAAGALLPVAWLAAHDALIAFFQTSFSIIWGLSDRSSRPYGDLLGVIRALQNRGNISALLGSKIFPSYLAPLVIIWGVAHLIVRSGRKGCGNATATMAVPLMGALVFFRAMIRRPDADHLAKLMPLLYLVLVLLLRFHASSVLIWVRSAGRRWFHVLGPIIMALLCMGVLTVLAQEESETAPALRLAAREEDDSATARGKGMRRLNVERAGPAVVAPPHEAAWVEDVVSFITERSRPLEPFYDFTNKGLFYFLADRPLPTRYPQTTYAATRAAQREVIADLERERPRLVLFPSGDPWKYGYDWLIHPFRHPLVARYLYRVYEPIRVIDDLLILERRDAKGLPAPNGVERFLARAPFTVDLHYLPRLLGQRPEPMRIVRKWDANTIATEWRFPRDPNSPSNLQEGIFLLPASAAISSPKLGMNSGSVDAVILCLAADGEGQARLQFRSAHYPSYGTCGQLNFSIIGDGDFHDHRVEVGLLPSWIWRGPITGLRLENRNSEVPIEVERIELIRYQTVDD